MSKVTFKMTGLKELERALGQLPQAVRRRVGLKVLREAGQPVAKAARALAPVAAEAHWIGSKDKGNRRLVDPGGLRESIDVSATLATSQRGDKGSLAPVEMYIGPGQHPQAITEEFGTFDQTPHPFLRPAWEAEKINTLDIAGTLLGIEIDKAAKRIGPKG
jgi:HK97 gp10 family phage protein